MPLVELISVKSEPMSDGAGAPGESEGRTPDAARRSPPEREPTPSAQLLSGTLTQLVVGLVLAAIGALAALAWQAQEHRFKSRTEAASRLFDLRRDAFSEFCDEMPRGLAGAYDMMQACALAWERRLSIAESAQSEDAALRDLRAEYRRLKDRLFFDAQASSHPLSLCSKSQSLFAGHHKAQAECQRLYDIINAMIDCPNQERGIAACVEEQHRLANDQYSVVVLALGRALEQDISCSIESPTRLVAGRETPLASFEFVVASCAP